MGTLQQDAAAAGLSTFRNAALKATAVKVKGDSVAGQLYGWFVQNLDNTQTYFHFWDAASPTVGSDTPKLSLWVPASGGIDAVLPHGIGFTTAIYVAATTTLGGSTNPTNGLLVNLYYV